MKKILLSLSIFSSLFAFSESTSAMVLDHALDMNECKVRITSQPYAGVSYDNSLWEVHDPKFNKDGDFGALSAHSYHVSGPTHNENGTLITKLEYPVTNTSPIRAINAFLFHATDIRRGNTTFVWVNKAQNDLTYLTLTTKFAFQEDERPLYAIASANNITVPLGMTQLMGINSEIYGKLIIKR